MLFSFDSTAFESEKERNFYYKVFAGYWLNELIPDLQDRLDAFLAVLSAPRFKGPKAPPLVPLVAKSAHASFDNHEHRIAGPRTDHGEFADILIQDEAGPVLYAIEAKLYSDWKYPKDVLRNGDRLSRIAKLLPKVSIIPVLLLSEKKWSDSKHQSGTPGSHYKRLDADKCAQVRVICWEDLANKTKDLKVRRFISERLRTPKSSMKVNTDTGWFRRDTTHSIADPDSTT